jgi:hypothetical protein
MSFLLPALLGGAAAGILPKLLGGSHSMKGYKPELKKFETLNHRQKDVLNSLLKHLNVKLPQTQQNPLYQQGSSYLQSILSQDPEMMKQFEAPAMRQFNEQIVPGIAERFSGAGARSSSGFNQAMGQAGSGLAERLASMRAGLGMQAQNAAMGYAQIPFQEAYNTQGMNLNRTQLGLGTPAFGYQAFGGQPGGMSAMMGGLSQGIGSGLGSGLGSLLQGLF